MAAKAESGTAPVERVHLVSTKREYRCILAAARALRVPTATLIWTAALEAVHRLGYYEGHEPPSRPKPGLWPDAPQRLPGETATERLNVSVAPLHLRTIERAAVEHLGADYRLSLRGRPAPVPAFLIGAGLRFIATQLQRARAVAADSRRLPAERRAAERFVRAVEDALDSGTASVLKPYLAPAR
jgi:hypothetical protein